MQNASRSQSFAEVLSRKRTTEVKETDIHLIGVGVIGDTVT
jgi:hypothetical protein